jgi:hypothetical protein
MNVPFTTTCTAIWAAMLLAGPASAGNPAAGKLSRMPVAIAMTFLTAPPTSTPATSALL